MNSQQQFSDYKEEARYYCNQADSYHESGELEKALEACDTAIMIDWDLPEAYNLRGIIYEDMDRPRDAIRDYKKAIKIDSEFEEAKENHRILADRIDGSRNFVTIAKFVSPEEAELHKTRLESEGIVAFVPRTSWLSTVTLGGAILNVEESKVSEALHILSDVLDDSTRVELAESTSDYYCTKCGKDVGEDWELCLNCGEPLDEPESEEESSDYVCPSCKAAVSAKWETCPQCRERLIEVVGYACTSCGNDVEEDWNHCPICGESLDEEESAN